MNQVVHIPGLGAREFGPNDARKAAAYLGPRIGQINEFEQAGYLRAIRDLELAADKDSEFDMARYTPPGYEPGWK